MTRRPFEFSLIRSVSVIFALTSMLLINHSASAADALDESRAVIQQWVRTEQLISQESQQWREEQASISDILNILAVEQRELTEQIALAQEIATQADEERALLIERLSGYQRISGLLETRVSDYERQLLLIAAYLPQTLKKELAPRFARINLQSSTATFSLSDRAQTVLSILSEIESFDTKLTLATEIIANSQGEPTEVQVLYIGLARAFYINDNATSGGFGVASETGWQWQTANELTASISRAIDVYQTRLTPQFVQLPMQVN